MKRNTVVDQYCGWGGGALGFHNAGFECLLAVDYDKHPRKCFKLNFPGVPVKGWDLLRLTGSVLREYLKLQPLDLDVLMMSPSCQGISKAGKMDPYDLRNIMFLHSIKNGIPGVMPKVFVIENVANLDEGRMQVFGDMVKGELDKLHDYVWDVRKMNALHFSTPSDRERMIFVGVHKSLSKDATFPEPQTPTATGLRIQDVLPEIDGLMYGYGFTKFKAPDEFANTVTKTVNLKAYVNHETVKLTIPQVLKLCGYPADWKYSGNYDQVWGRAGNSVMPRLSEAIAIHLRDQVLP